MKFIKEVKNYLHFLKIEKRVKQKTFDIIVGDHKMSLLEQWKELKVLVESLDLDVHKNASGNKSAGVWYCMLLNELMLEPYCIVTVDAEPPP